MGRIFDFLAKRLLEPFELFFSELHVQFQVFRFRGCLLDEKEKIV